MGQNEPFWVPKTGVVTGNFLSLSGGVVETDFFRRADFSVGGRVEDAAPNAKTKTGRGWRKIKDPMMGVQKKKKQPGAKKNTRVCKNVCRD